MAGILTRLKDLRKMHWGINLVILVMVAVGVMFIHSAVNGSLDPDAWKLPYKQIVWFTIGAAVYLFLTLCDYRDFSKFVWLTYGATLFLLVLVLLVGGGATGAKRWLTLYGGVTLQPSEVAKLALVLVLSVILSRPDVNRRSFKLVAWLILIVSIPWFLVVAEPDLGTAMVFLPTAFILMYAGGISLRMLGVMVVFGALLIGIVLGLFLLPEKLGASPERQDEIVRAIGLNPYHRDRIVYFLNPEKDPRDAGWNKIQSEIAVGSGGVWGKGWKQGTQNILGFLPRTVTPTDFIYSVIAEEKGFAGSFAVLILLGLLIGFGGQAAFMARDMLGRLLCVGVVTLIFCHSFINIAMTIGLMPITGLPLPLLSYGGSFMVMTMAGLGIIQSVYLRSLPRRQEFID